MFVSRMDEQVDAAVEGAPTGDTGEGSDTSFYNRRMHNYPLIKVGLWTGISFVAALVLFAQQPRLLVP